MDELKPIEELDYCQICGETITAGELVCNDCRSGRKGRTVMERSEPSTEIVEEITNQSTTHDIVVVLKMIVQYLESFTMDKMSRDAMSAAADRLESQEREIERLIDALKFYQKEEAINANR